jgi:hypothetical protein
MMIYYVIVMYKHKKYVWKLLLLSLQSDCDHIIPTTNAGVQIMNLWTYTYLQSKD